jgi:hypothetical protein
VQVQTAVLLGVEYRGPLPLSLHPALNGSLQQFADQALVGDSPGGGFGLDGVEQRFGDAHVDAGILGGGFLGEGAELGEIEGREVLVEESLGLGVSGH